MQLATSLWDLYEQFDDTKRAELLRGVFNAIVLDHNGVVGVTLKPPFAHMGSRKNLLGDSPDDKLVDSLCNNEQVTDKTPPTFLFHTADDNAVPVENSILFFEAPRKAKVPAELHVYRHGRHGVGLAPNEPALSSWPDCLEAWMKDRGLLSSK